MNQVLIVCALLASLLAGYGCQIQVSKAQIEIARIQAGCK